MAAARNSARADAARLVLAHWRASPSSCRALYDLPMLNRQWVEGLVKGEHGAAPTTVAFLVNLLAAVSIAGRRVRGICRGGRSCLRVDRTMRTSRRAGVARRGRSRRSRVVCASASALAEPRSPTSSRGHWIAAAGRRPHAPVAPRTCRAAPTAAGTCWPGPSNTGVPAGTQLTDYTGPCSITAANTVIDGKTVNCALGIQAPRTSRSRTARSTAP